MRWAFLVGAIVSSTASAVASLVLGTTAPWVLVLNGWSLGASTATLALLFALRPWRRP